jgi:hypothetical protein
MSKAHPLGLVDQFIERGMQLVVVGGHAVNFHGYLRATEDVDIVFKRTSETEQTLLQTLQENGAYWIGDDIDAKTGLESVHPVTMSYIQNTRLMMLGSNAGWLDLFDFIPGMPNEPLDDLFATAVYAEGRPFASLDWIKRMKRVAGRPQDQLDLDNLP